MLVPELNTNDYPFRYDQQKAKEVILYIANNAPIPDTAHICKITYFADKYHLENYARLICGDKYSALQYGPVPSGLYDLIKAADINNDDDIVVSDSGITALREANLDELSESDIEAINWAIKEYGHLSFNELSKRSHDEIWNAITDAGRKIVPNDTVRSIHIPFQNILNSLKNGELIWDYLQENR